MILFSRSLSPDDMFPMLMKPIWLIAPLNHEVTGLWLPMVSRANMPGGGHAQVVELESSAMGETPVAGKIWAFSHYPNFPDRYCLSDLVLSNEFRIGQSDEIGKKIFRCNFSR